MTYQLILAIPDLPKPVNQLTSRHWRIRHGETKKWLRLVGHQILVSSSGKPESPLKKAYLVLTRFSATSPDSDGLVSSFKSVIDALVKHGILKDDGYENIGMPKYRWMNAPRGRGSIRIEVRETE